MKIETKDNNPVAVGLLLCVLAGTVTMTIRQLLPQDVPVVAVTAAATAAAPAAGTTASGAESAPPVLWQGARRSSRRDPFYHPILSVRIGARANPAAPAVVAAAGNRAFSTAPAPPNFSQGLNVAVVKPGALRESVSMPAAPATPGRPQKRGVSVPVSPIVKRAGNAPPRFARLTAPQPVRDIEAELSAKMQVTAIFGMSQRSAVIEGAGADPITVRVGDRVQMLRVVAVNEYEVVLAGARGKWTLPLQAAPEGAADEPAPEENTDVPH